MWAGWLNMTLSRGIFAAAIVILVGIVCFDMMGVLVRILGDQYPVLQMASLRNLFGVIPPLIMIWKSGILAKLRPLNTPPIYGLTLIRSACVAVAQISFYTALTKIEFATATTLAYTSPFLVAALSVPLLGHKVGAWRWGAIVAGFGGVVMILKPFGDGFSLYMLLPVLAALGYALSSVLVRRYPPEASSYGIQLTQQICTMVLTTILLFTFSAPVAITSATDAGLLILMGIFGGVGVLCLVISYRMVDPSAVAPFEYFGLPIAFCMGWFFFQETPFDSLFPGVLLIVGAGLLIIIRERHHQRQQS